ncbi:MAG: hypothetical protein KY475_25575 [Planctomycetes bacterium]|nr:hypothetical protein [Planctomycetota bacterium]
MTLEEMREYLDPVDYAALSAPAARPDRCPWCGGIWRHSHPCEELQRDWLTPFPWGRHKGKPLSGVPADYLRWALAKPDLMQELRRDIDREVEFRSQDRSNGNRPLSTSPGRSGRPASSPMPHQKEFVNEQS